MASSAWPKQWPSQALELHIFDPQGDVLLLLLRYPELGTESSATSSQCDLDEDRDEDESEASESDSMSDESLPQLLNFITTRSRAASAAVGQIEGSTSTNDTPEMQDSKDEMTILFSEINIEAAEEEPSYPKDVQMRVSSKHLALASPYFATLFGPNFAEGQNLRSEGYVSISLVDDDDPDAMFILMNIIHGRHRQVSREVPLKTLSELAVLIDKRQMLESVEIYSDFWIQALEKDLPNVYHCKKDIMSWLFISWVFQKEDIFRDMTRITERECDDSVDDDVRYLPIPSFIIGKYLEMAAFSLISIYVTDTLKHRRKIAMRKAMAVIYDLIVEYTGPKSHCNNQSNDKKQRFACDAMVLGSVIKAFAGPVFGTTVDEDEDEDEGLSFSDLVDEISEVDVLVADRCSSRGITHGVKDSINASIKSVEKTLCGLQLVDFLPKSRAQADE